MLTEEEMVMVGRKKSLLSRSVMVAWRCMRRKVQGLTQDRRPFKRGINNDQKAHLSLQSRKLILAKAIKVRGLELPKKNYDEVKNLIKNVICH